ncbi:MAG: exodeoxyribonuclease III [Acidimicrobiales bacterium]
MRLATWNVNSLRARLPRVEEWLAYAQPDVVCLQETKVADAAFPTMPFAALGYEAAYHGDGQWNGVAILSRVGLADVVSGFGDEPRVLAATCGGLRVVSLYVPNGRTLDSPQYPAKLAWLETLRAWIDELCDPDDAVALCGDFNIAPDDRDVYDPSKYLDTTHTSAAERAALARLEEWGLSDAFRALYPQDRLFTWWDYRAGDFHNHRGMRIDLILVTKVVAAALEWGIIDRNARKGKQPSDHAPVIVDIAGIGAT